MTNPLPIVAKEINVRLTKAERIISQANDHRLAAALLVAEARGRIEAGEAGNVTWSKWAAQNIDRSRSEVNKLLKIGQSDDPRAAVNDVRKKAAASMAKSRNVSNVGDKKTKEIQSYINRDKLWDAAWAAFSALEREDREVFIERAIASLEKETVP